MKGYSSFFCGFALATASMICLGQTTRALPLPLADGSFRLTSAQIKADEILALDGSPEAANKLANYYQGWTNDVPKAMKWYQVAAENGSAEAMWNYYAVATVVPFPDWARRGRFWLKKAAGMGDKLAIEELQDLENKKRTGK